MTTTSLNSDTGTAYVIVTGTTVNGWVGVGVYPEGAYIRGNTGSTYNQIYGRARFDAEL